MRRADRLFRLVQALRRRRVTTALQLSTELEVSERTIYRDVRDLVASGVPIAGEAGVGYALPKSFDLPPMTFTEDEIEALALGARVVESWGDATLAAAAAAVIAKIEASIPDRLRPRIAAAPLYAPGFHVPEEVTAQLSPLRMAIAKGSKVRFLYARPIGDVREDDQQRRAAAAAAKSSSKAKSDAIERVEIERTTRTVWPLGLFFWGTTWSLAAWCELREGFRTFRIDRIRRIKVLDEPSPSIAGRTINDYRRTMEAEAMLRREGEAPCARGKAKR